MYWARELILISRSACIATLIRFKFIRDFAISEDVTCEYISLAITRAQLIVLDAMVPLSIASFIEVALGCICASLATLRPFIQRFIIRSRKGRSFEAETGTDGSDVPVSSSYDSVQKSNDLREVVEVQELALRTNSIA